jgi:hypothetical protein
MARKAGDKIKNLPKGYDLNDPIVQKAAKGKNWGARDQKRYDRLSSNNSNNENRKEAKARVQGQPTGQGTVGFGKGQGKGEAMSKEEMTKFTQPFQPDQQGQIPPGTKPDRSLNTTFGIGGNLGQNVGKTGDTNTTIGNDNTIGHGATVGGDYSVTIGGNSAGNGQQGAGPSFGMNNMQLAASYSALNENSFHRSSAQLNGAGRAAQASSAANDITGATDRVANLYNATGMDQNYWRNKANAQSNFYLGDIFKEGFGGYDWTMPDSPNKIEDNTQEIYEDAKDEIKDV